MSRRQGSDDRTTWREYLRYRFDALLARGTWAVLLWLGILTFAVVLTASFLLRRAGVTLAGSEDAAWFEDFWQSMLRTLDTGTMASDSGWRQRLVALSVTIFGLLVLGTLIGVIATGVEAQIDRMKRGRSAVVESDHIVVLGASSLLPDVVDQLCRANAGSRTAIVVMADQDPTGLAEEVRQGVENTFGNRLVFRDGDPTRLADLELVRLAHCRTVVVLNGDGDHSGDARAVHTVLAVREALGDLDRTPIVVVLDEPAVAETLVASLDEAVHPIVITQAVARNVVFALRERGLGEVMAELSDFRGADIYVLAAPGLVGTRFGDVVVGALEFRPIALMRDTGAVELTPSFDEVIGSTDRLVVVAHEPTVALDVDAEFVAEYRIGHGDRPDFRSEAATQHVLVVGWSGLGLPLLRGWAMSAGAGSTVEVVFDPRLIDQDDIDVPDLGDIPVVLKPLIGEITTLGRRVAPQITAIVLLAYRDHLPPEEVDSRTLLELMTLRRDLEDRPESAPRLVVELTDPGNSRLADVRGVDEVIVTPAMASRILAQLVDDPTRRAVYLALYATGGSSLHLVEAERLDLRGTVTMRDIVVSAAAHGVLAIGWRRSGESGGELVLNPSADRRLDLASGDDIVVVG
jgi:Castor and Pollux, part of voltage-gated ion channel/Calcium-activated potassium channel slowpoke-like RCK domain